MERQVNYDCRSCRINNWIDKQHRVCFLANKEQELPFPKFIIEDEKGNISQPRQAIENGQYAVSWELVAAEGVYDWLRVMEDLFPSMPELDALQTFLKPLCVESIIDPYIYFMFSLENAVAAYGIDALKLRLDLFTIFESIRAANNLYENLDNFKREQEVKSNSINRVKK